MYLPAMSIDDVVRKGFEKLFTELRLWKVEMTAWAAFPEEMQETADE